MPTLDEHFRAFAKKYPKPSAHPNGPTGNGDTTWDQDCAAFVYRFGLFVVGSAAWEEANDVYGPTAWDVCKASGTLVGDASKAPGGAIHWWRSSTLSGAPGHVGVDLDGGGDRLAMATYAADPELAPALGYQSVDGYSAAKKTMKYAGWTLNYGGAKFPITLPAGGGGVPIEDEDDEMSKNAGFRYTRAADHAVVCLVINPASGFTTEWSNGKTAVGSYNDPIAATFGTGPFAAISEGHAKALKASCAAVLEAQGVEVGDITVENSPEEVAALQSIAKEIGELAEEQDAYRDGKLQSD